MGIAKDPKRVAIVVGGQSLASVIAASRAFAGYTLIETAAPPADPIEHAGWLAGCDVVESLARTGVIHGQGKPRAHDDQEHYRDAIHQRLFNPVRHDPDATYFESPRPLTKRQRRRQRGRG